MESRRRRLLILTIVQQHEEGIKVDIQPHTTLVTLTRTTTAEYPSEDRSLR
jgi:hypothetical protein